jgi:hypothetical protein
MNAPVICSLALESMIHESEMENKRQWDAISIWARVAVEEEETRL